MLSTVERDAPEELARAVHELAYVCSLLLPKLPWPSAFFASAKSRPDAMIEWTAVTMCRRMRVAHISTSVTISAVVVVVMISVMPPADHSGTVEGALTVGRRRLILRRHLEE